MPVTAIPSPTGHPAYRDTFRCVPKSVANARDLVRTALYTWALDELAHDGVVIISELMTNAIQHAESHSARVTVTRLGPELVRIAVVDRSPFFPVRRRPKVDDTGGRGLAVIERLALKWGTDPLIGGKCVWAELGSGSTCEVTSR